MRKDDNDAMQALYANLDREYYGFGKLLILSWDLYAKCYPILILTGMILHLPIFVMAQLISTYYGHSETTFVLISVTSILATLLLALAHYNIIDNFLRGEEVTITRSFAFGLHHLGPTLATSLLAVVIVTLLMFLLVIPGIIWAVYYSFLIYVVADKGLAGKKALDYSKSLVIGRWFHVFIYGLLISLLISIFALLAEQPILTFTTGITTLLFSEVLFIFLSAFTSVAFIVLYKNLDRPKEPESLR